MCFYIFVDFLTIFKKYMSHVHVFVAAGSVASVWTSRVRSPLGPR